MPHTDIHPAAIEAPPVVAGRLVALVRVALAALATAADDPNALPDALLRVEMLAESAGAAVTDALCTGIPGGTEALRTAAAAVAPELFALAGHAVTRRLGDTCPLCATALYITEDSHGATIQCRACDYITPANIASTLTTAGRPMPAADPGPRRFILDRERDLTGYSGTGRVAEGVVWSDGRVSMRWCGDGKPRTTTEADSLAHIADIHGHDGATHVVMLDADDGSAR